MKEALYAVLWERIEQEKPIVSEINDNALLGEKYRAYEQAIILLNGFFKDIESFEDKKVGNNEFNKEI